MTASSTAAAGAAADESFITIPKERFDRLMDVLAVMSLGDLDPSRTQLEITHDDEFSVVEHTLNLLGDELRAARSAGEVSMQKVEAARQELEEKLNTIEQQRLAIRDLSTPIIELWDDILTLPIVGVVDTQRSVEMTQRLLHRIIEGQARCVIIDITGVDVVDTMTANHFIKMVNAAKLLGAFCVVTGISPHISQTLTQIGVSFQEVPTLRNLKEGLRECFLHLQRRNRRS